MLPAALFLAAFVAWPLVRLITDSFFDISPIQGRPREFVGFDNYARALGLIGCRFPRLLRRLLQQRQRQQQQG